jgi:tetratricopeptide (TPR) repeat protein
MANIRSRFLANSRLSWAAGAALATGLLFVGAAAVAADKPQNSAKVGKILQSVQEDLKAKKYTEAITKLKEADATAGKNAYDQHFINEMLGFAYGHTGNNVEAAKAYEAELDDGFMSAADLPARIRLLAGVEYDLKNYDKSIEYGNRAIKGGFADEDTRTRVGQAYYLKGDWKATYHFEDGLIDGAIKNGQTPKNDQLQLALSACAKMDDSACINKQLERLVIYYPKPEYWQNLLFTLIKETANSDANTLQTFRLMSEVDVLKSADDYIELAQLAMDAGSPGEAQRALQRGFDKNVFADQRSKDKAQRLLEKAKAKATADLGTLDKIAKEADAAPNGGKNAAMGLAYLGYGQYDKAVDQYGKAISKGSLKSPAETQLMLGISEYKAGHKDDAMKAFKAVKGDPILERLGGFWALHARQGQ